MPQGTFATRIAALRRLVAVVILFAAPVAASAQDDLPEVVRTLIETGDRQRDAGRYEQAIESYREALRLAPSAVEVYLSLGALYHQRDELERSLETFEAGLAVADDRRDLLYNAAVVALELGRAEEALGHAERGLEGARRDVDLLMVESTALARLERPREALDALEAAAAIRRGDPRILFRLGNLHQQLGDRQQAVDAYRAAIKEDRGMERAYYNLGAVLYEMERYDEALEAYRKALAPLEEALERGQQVDPIHARAFLNLGAIYSRREEWPTALAAYRRAVALDEALPQAHYNLGYVHYAMNDWAAAKVAYERALSLDGELPLAYLHLGRIAQRRGELEDAVRWLEAGLPRFDAATRREALRALADSRRGLGRLDGAEAAYRELLSQGADDFEVLVALAELLLQRGAQSEGRTLLERAHDLAPGRLEIALKLAALVRSQGDVAAEKGLYQEVLERGGERPELWPVRLRLALALLGEGRFEDARRHVAALAGAAGRKPGGRAGGAGPSVEERQRIAVLHGALLAAAGERAAARQQWHAAEGFAPADAALALLEGSEGRTGASLPELERAAATDGALKPVAQANLGQALWLAGRGERAREHLMTAAEAFPESPVPPAALGDLEVRQGRFRSAAEYLETAAQRCTVAVAGDSADGSEGGVLRVALGGSQDFCTWVDRHLGLALARTALEDLKTALAGGIALGEVAVLVERALALPLPAAERAVALYVRGTLAVAQGDAQAARRALVAALAGELPADLAPFARNNLGAARLELGDIELARVDFGAARAAGRLDAVLNLGILEDEHGSARQALAYYDEYLAAGGARRGEVTAWIERLRQIYR